AILVMLALRRRSRQVVVADAEPLLGDLTPWLSGLAWAIVGGESGARRRPMALPWLLRGGSQCHAASIGSVTERLLSSHCSQGCQDCPLTFALPLLTRHHSSDL